MGRSLDFARIGTIPLDAGRVKWYVYGVIKELEDISAAWLAARPTHTHVSYHCATDLQEPRILLHFWARYDGEEYGYPSARDFLTLEDAWVHVRSFGDAS